MKNLKIFNKSIALPYTGSIVPKIAVVGNAGVVGSDNIKIEECDIVIRFNNYATREKITHTGNRFKCDILFTTFDLHSNGCLPRDVVIGIPFPFKARDVNDKVKKLYPDSRMWMVDPYNNMEMCDELNINSLGYEHPFPSIGFTALWHMKDWMAEFYVCGFEWYYTGGSSFQGWDLKRTDYPKAWNHNYPKEVIWTLENLLPKNNFIFSDRCKTLLNIARNAVA